MAQANDLSWAPSNSPTASETNVVTRATTLPLSSTPDVSQTADRCLQDIDPSQASTLSHFADCNLECCHCAVRWNGRRIMLENEA